MAGTFRIIGISLFLLGSSLTGTSGVDCAIHWPAQSSEYGPEITSFLEYINHEDVELEFQIKHNEISRKDYERSKSRLVVHREAVLSRFKRTGEDYVPEYNVLAASEVGDILPNGLQDLKGRKPGDMIDNKWKFVGMAIKGEKFYIFERTRQ